MKSTLENLGFKVDIIADGTYRQISDGVESFRKKLAASKGAYGVFFFSGHGSQDNGENYLYPIDSEGLLARCVSERSVLEEMQKAKNYLNIVLIDACRSNPYTKGKQGLTAPEIKPPGSIIVYATSTGKTATTGTGRISPFTTALIEKMSNQNLPAIAVSRVCV